MSSVNSQGFRGILVRNPTKTLRIYRAHNPGRICQDNLWRCGWPILPETIVVFSTDFSRWKPTYQLENDCMTTYVGRATNMIIWAMKLDAERIPTTGSSSILDKNEIRFDEYLVLCIKGRACCLDRRVSLSFAHKSQWYSSSECVHAVGWALLCGFADWLQWLSCSVLLYLIAIAVSCTCDLCCFRALCMRWFWWETKFCWLKNTHLPEFDLSWHLSCYLEPILILWWRAVCWPWKRNPISYALAGLCLLSGCWSCYGTKRLVLLWNQAINNMTCWSC